MELPLKLRIREESVQNAASWHTMPWFLKRPPKVSVAHCLTGPAGLATASHTGGRDVRFPLAKSETRWVGFICTRHRPHGLPFQHPTLDSLLLKMLMPVS